MRVRRSLTIKQMAAVSTVAVITICIFILIQLFHFVQQRREDYAQQLENIAHSVRKPLSQAVLDVNLNETQEILNTLRPVGILSRADVVMPNEIAALHTNFPAGRPVPEWITRGFKPAGEDFRAALLGGGQSERPQTLSLFSASG
ncbi:hypothetical protein ACVW2B_003170 [Ewingella americana]